MGKIITLLALVSLLATAVPAQELRPYQPPGGRSPGFEQFQGPGQSSGRVDETVYERFRADVQRMEPANRKKLTAVLQERLNRARQDQRYEEARYNERLLGILGSIR